MSKVNNWIPLTFLPTLKLNIRYFLTARLSAAVQGWIWLLRGVSHRVLVCLWASFLVSLSTKRNRETCFALWDATNVMMEEWTNVVWLTPSEVEMWVNLVIWTIPGAYIGAGMWRGGHRAWEQGKERPEMSGAWLLEYVAKEKGRRGLPCAENKGLEEGKGMWEMKESGRGQQRKMRGQGTKEQRERVWVGAVAQRRCVAPTSPPSPLTYTLYLETLHGGRFARRCSCLPPRPPSVFLLSSDSVTQSHDVTQLKGKCSYALRCDMEADAICGRDLLN